MAKEVEVSAEQLSFLKRTVEIVSVEGLEDQFDVTLMLLQRLQPDDDIIEVNMANAANERTERVEHVALVGARSIPTTLRHHGPFVQAERSGDCGIFDMIWVNTGLEERVSHVQFPPDDAASAIREDLLNTWQGRPGWCSH